MPRETGRKLIAQNRKARHDYEILDTYEAGIVLVGTEVKSLRAGKATLADGYATVSQAAQTFFTEVRAGSFPDEDHSFRSTTMRLVASNPDVKPSEREEKSGVYGVPV